MLPKSIFHEQEAETEKNPPAGIVGIDAQNYCQHRVAGVGQNFVIEKFNEMMLKKRPRPDLNELSIEPPSKRQRRGGKQQEMEKAFA